MILHFHSNVSVTYIFQEASVPSVTFTVSKETPREKARPQTKVLGSICREHTALNAAWLAILHASVLRYFSTTSTPTIVDSNRFFHPNRTDHPNIYQRAKLNANNERKKTTSGE